MNMGFVTRGYLGLLALIAISLAMSLFFAPPAAAQGNGNSTVLGVISDPLELPSDPGQRYQVNLYLYAPGTGSRSAETTFDILIDCTRPGGPMETYRRTLVVPHQLDARGRVTRISLIQKPDNFELWCDGALHSPNALQSLPAGATIFAFVVNAHTEAKVQHSHYGAILGGLSQVADSTGKVVVVKKEHIPAGNVTLYK